MLRSAGTVTMGTNDNAALASGTTLFYGSNTGNSFPSFPIFNITHVTNGGISSSLFSGANASLTSASSVLASQPQNGTVTFAFGTLTLTGSNTTTNYFNISGANLASTSSMQITCAHGRNGFHQRKWRHGPVLRCEYFDYRNIFKQGSIQLLPGDFHNTLGHRIEGKPAGSGGHAFCLWRSDRWQCHGRGNQRDERIRISEHRLFTGNSPGAADYTISYVAGALTVTPVALTITAVNQTSVYGAALPALAATYAGFVNGDTAASLTTQPTLSTTAASRQPCLEQPVRHHGQRRRRQRLQRSVTRPERSRSPTRR